MMDLYSYNNRRIGNQCLLLARIDSMDPHIIAIKRSSHGRDSMYFLLNEGRILIIFYIAKSKAWIAFPKQIWTHITSGPIEPDECKECVILFL